MILDFRETRKQLQNVAGSLQDPESDALRQRNLKRINFIHHNYFLLFRVVDQMVYVTDMFHCLEDYENKLH